MFLSRAGSSFELPPYSYTTPPSSPTRSARAPLSHVSSLVDLTTKENQAFGDQVADLPPGKRYREELKDPLTNVKIPKLKGEFQAVTTIDENSEEEAGWVPQLPVHVLDMLADIINSPEPTPRNVKTVQFGSHEVQLASPGSVTTPKRRVVADTSKHWPETFIEVNRQTDGSAKITCPEKWKNLGYVVYMAISDDGRILIGRSDDLEKRLGGYEKELTKGQRSLGEAWREGKRVIIAPLHLCSSYETARQNETSFIVAKESKHNRNRGNGDPRIDFGSPLKNGGGGKLREDYLKPLAERYRTLEPITDLAAAQPKLWCQLHYNKQDDYIEVNIPAEWRGLHSAVYVIDVMGKLYIGETGLFGPRLSSHLSNTNGHATNSNQLLPREIRKALKADLKVALGILGVCNPTKLRERKLHEARVIEAKGTLLKDGGLNKRTEVKPNESPTSPLRALNSPRGPMHMATIRDLRTVKCKLMTRIEKMAQTTTQSTNNIVTNDTGTVPITRSTNTSDNSQSTTDSTSSNSSMDESPIIAMSPGY